METKYTPGPWFTKREGYSTVYVEARLRAGVLQEIAACGPTEAGQDQQEANAHLIAAAPDLLAALLAARTSVEANRDTIYESHYQPHTGDVDAEGRDAVDAEDALLSRIDAAIAKATGAI